VSFIFCVVVFGLTACNKDPYHKLVEQEAATGKRYDSLFLGMKLGMERKEFYDQCWKLNKQQLIMQGPSNMSVEYKINELKEPALFRFYPNFYKDKVYEMPGSFSYDSWAPWNKHLFADSLLEDVKTLLEKWYGEGFIKVSRKDGKFAYVKVNGNRRISLYTVSDQYVHAIFTDLTVEKEAEEAKKKMLQNEEGK
jgi:hypothetical protein